MSFNDFIREPEKNEYTEKFIALMKELNPKGILEQTFATETMGAIWRLRRCGLVESGLALTPGAPDPMAAGPGDTAIEKILRVVDRGRAQSHNILSRSLAGLRNLQTERQVRIQLFIDGKVPGDLGVMDFQKVYQLGVRFNPDHPTAPPAAPKPPAPEETPSQTPDQPLTKESMARPYPNNDPSEDRQPITKESMARPYPNCDRSEDRQTLVGGSFCKPAPRQPPYPPNSPETHPAPAVRAKNTSAAAASTSPRWHLHRSTRQLKPS
jgi:hypothetical protein